RTITAVTGNIMVRAIRFANRRAIAVLRQIKNGYTLRFPGKPLQLHLGCGKKRIENFINIDRNISPATDYVTNAARLPCPADSVERIETYHVIEHIPYPVVKSALTDWHRVLRPGGTLVLECPDVNVAMREYLEGNAERLYSI